jgi:hypothetical protein
MGYAGANTNPIVYLRTDKDTHFTGAIAQNAKEDESIAFPNPMARTNECIIEGIAIQADQNLEWDIFIWSGSEYDNTDLDSDKFIEFVNFTATEQKQIAASNQFYTAKTGLSIPYRDTDATNKLHVSLCNRSVTAKNAGANGEVVIVFMLRPIYFS